MRHRQPDERALQVLQMGDVNRGKDRGQPRRLPPQAAFRQGLLSNLGNPKMAVFFMSLLPQFTSAEGRPFLPILQLGLMFSAMTFLWLTAYAAAIARAGDVLQRRRVRRLLDAVTGVALVGLGLRLATESR